MNSKTQTGKATARPWNQDGQMITTGDGKRNLARCVALDAEIEDANAALIVRAVNEYAALLAIAESAKSDAENGMRTSTETLNALAALAAIQGKESK